MNQIGTRKRARVAEGVNGGASPSRAGKIGWAGLGLISLCGLTCCLPLVFGGLAVGGTATWTFMSLNWPLALAFGILLLAGAAVLLAGRRNQARPFSGTPGSGINESASSSCVESSACSAGGSCGCRD